jgi:NTE family protein
VSDQATPDGRSDGSPPRHTRQSVKSAITHAVVLGGGGLAGIAWELGVLRGVTDVYPDLLAMLTSADRIIGTSAGAVVAAQITSGIDLDTLYAAQLQPTTSEIDIDFDPDEQRAQLAATTAGATTLEHAGQRLGAFALTTQRVNEALRRAAIAARLPVHTWPRANMMVTAVDAHTGRLQVFTKHSGVELVDAVAASCAVPGIWPATTIGNRRYIDGAARSTTNADLAAECDRVLIIAPAPDASASPFDVPDGFDRVNAANVLILRPDTSSVAAFGPNPLSPATRAPSARAGRSQGREHAAGIAALWQ